MLQLLMLTILQVSSENIFQNVLYNAQISDYLDYVDSWSPLLLQNNIPDLVSQRINQMSIADTKLRQWTNGKVSVVRESFEGTPVKRCYSA